MNKFIYPYMKGSKSAIELKNALGGKLIRRENSKFKPRGKTVINWGCSRLPQNIVDNAIIINTPQAVARATNKLTTMRVLSEAGVSVPVFTTDANVARDLIVDEGCKIFCRTKLTGHSGAGIVVAETVNELVEAPLYTVWNQIKNEYRVHVVRGKAIDVQRKARKHDVPDDQVTWKIRNLAGGFIFARGDCQPENGIKDQAIKAVEALGLDFGAVDTIYSKKGKVVVLEVNTACGLVGTTLESYVKAFGEL